jgi:hypothetical protein
MSNTFNIGKVDSIFRSLSEDQKFGLWNVASSIVLTNCPDNYAEFLQNEIDRIVNE